MKRVNLTIIFLMCSLLLSAQSLPEVSTADFAKLRWLEGTWVRTDAKPGHSAHEVWTRATDDAYNGVGVSLKGSDTTFVEKLKIAVKDGGIFYIADVPENSQPVYFRFTNLTDSTFVCENATHDFPKKISYSLEGSKLTASISGNGQEISFVFVKPL